MSKSCIISRLSVRKQNITSSYLVIGGLPLYSCQSIVSIISLSSIVCQVDTNLHHSTLPVNCDQFFSLSKLQISYLFRKFNPFQQSRYWRLYYRQLKMEAPDKQKLKLRMADSNNQKIKRNSSNMARF